MNILYDTSSYLISYDCIMKLLQFDGFCYNLIEFVIMCRLLAPAWFPCCSECGCNAIGSLLAPYRFALSALGGCRSVRCGGAWAVVGGACYGAISMHQPNVPKINRRIKQIYLYMYTCMCEYIGICIMCVYTCICICICIYIYIYGHVYFVSVIAIWS